MPRAALVAVALAVAACSNPAGRGASDGGSSLPPPPGCNSYPSGVVQVVSGNPSLQTAMAVAFQMARPGATCSDMTMGSCVMTTTTQTGVAPTTDAGTVTVSGGAATLMATPMATTGGGTGYANVTSMQSLWQGGESIVVSAAGGSAVPAFSSTLLAPSPATVTMPARPASGALALSRQDDLAISWSGDGYGSVDAELLGVGVGSVYVHCRWPVAAHTGAVPAAMLAGLPATQSSLVVTRQSTQLVTDGAWSVDVILATGGLDAAGALASYSVAFN